MKKILFILAAAFLLISCSKNKKTDVQIPNEKINAIDSAKSEVNMNHNIKLAYNFHKGDELNYKMTSISSKSQSIIAEKEERSTSNQTVKYRFKFKIISNNHDGSAALEVTIISITLTADMNGNKVEYDSSDEMPDSIRSKFMQYEVLVNKPYKIDVSENGDILRLYDLNPMMNSLLKFHNYTKKLSPDEKVQIKNNLAHDALKPLTQQIIRPLSNKEVNIDSTWQTKIQSTISVFKVENITTFKVSSFSKPDSNIVANINASLSLNIIDQKDISKNNINYSFDKPILQGNGNILFDIKKGYILKSETNTNLLIRMSVEATGKTNEKLTGTREDNTITTNIVELI